MVEVILVVLVVGILAAVTIPAVVNMSDDAKMAVTRTRLKELKEAITGDPRLITDGQFVKPGFISDLGVPPASLSELSTIGAYATYDPMTKKGWRGPYVNSTETDWDHDGWGTALQYDASGRTLTSCGPDKSCGNGDDVVENF